jgi:two-component system chemotaxis sensor kinase CheA
VAARRKKKTGAPPRAAKAKPDASEAQGHREFVSEAEEILERMLEDLSDLQEHRKDGSEIDPELINRVFRSAHSLKGLAGMFGMDAIGRLAHHLEDILDALRLGRIAVDSPVIGLLDEGAGLLIGILTHVESENEEGEGDIAAANAFILRIEEAVALCGAAGAEAEEVASIDVDPAVLRALTEYEEHRLHENIRIGREISIVDSIFDLTSFEDGLTELSMSIREVGEVISTLPSPGDAPDSQIRFSLLVATDIDAERLGERIEQPDTEIRTVRAAAPAKSDTQDDTTAAGSQEQGGRASPAATPPESTDIESLRSIGETIRVDVRKLDELMNLVGELVIQRNAIADVVGRLSMDADTARIGADLGKIHVLLKRKLKDLQVRVLDVRMVPMRQVFERLSRVVRRLRRDLGKDVELEFSGADTELDKLIVENLVDPLLHLVRNAFDHAIETPDERAALRKSASGTIHVRAMQRGNHVVVEVQDDGRGMDAESILAEARARGLVSDSETPSRRDVLDLVFEPGFSTREEVSSTSGRGVGMDVVRSNLAGMGGAVELTSTEGRGTTVTITLPITLAIMQALIVSVGVERYAVPLASVLETLAVEPDQIGHSEGREILNLRGEPLLLKRLGEELDIECGGRDARQFAVVVGVGEQRLGILVDRLQGQQDAVIKPIKGPVQQIYGIAGAAELGDRNPILVVDVYSIASEKARGRVAA